MAKTVTKSSGRDEAFDVRKLADSLIRSGASSDAAFAIAERVENEIGPSSHTRHIFKLAKRLLKQQNHVSGMRYSLKRAIFALGPSGYPFEKYFARVLKAYGYAVELDKFIEGYCVTHEVDVVAHKDDEHFMIECKYHNEGGKPTDVKIALYVHSRFADINKAYELKRQATMMSQGWLVTNTRCTSDAIQYASCVGLKIVSWRYPEKESLETMIEEKRLYPVTILPSARKDALEVLFRNDIILVKDIADTDEELFIGRSGLDRTAAKLLKQEADRLCPCL
ncbi:MAG TPA: restriction endonuclease [Thermodesulfovibrionales bacterium]|nr:restriction endonuclease [Thermodesulfovibrionales bacterium]